MFITILLRQEKTSKTITLKTRSKTDKSQRLRIGKAYLCTKNVLGVIVFEQILVNVPKVREHNHSHTALPPRETSITHQVFCFCFFSPGRSFRVDTLTAKLCVHKWQPDKWCSLCHLHGISYLPPPPRTIRHAQNIETDKILVKLDMWKILQSHYRHENGIHWWEWVWTLSPFMPHLQLCGTDRPGPETVRLWKIENIPVFSHDTFGSCMAQRARHSLHYKYEAFYNSVTFKMCHHFHKHETFVHLTCAYSRSVSPFHVSM